MGWIVDLNVDFCGNYWKKCYGYRFCGSLEKGNFYCGKYFYIIT
jgi:hypothetical protein